MPSGAKKRKAAKKKKEQEAHQIHNSDNSNNLSHGNDDPRSQDEKESDGDVSSPVSIDHDDKESVKEVTVETEAIQIVVVDIEDAITIERELNSEENNVENPKSLPEKVSQATGKVTLQEASFNSILETVPIDDSVKHVVSESNEEILVESKPDESSVVSGVARPMPKENEENEGKLLSLSGPLAETSKTVESIKESETPQSSEKGPLVASTLPFVQRTSWLSCCGLLDVMTGSTR